MSERKVAPAWCVKQMLGPPKGSTAALLHGAAPARAQTQYAALPMDSSKVDMLLTCGSKFLQLPHSAHGPD